MGDVSQFDCSSALLSINAAEVDANTVIQVGCEIARVYGSDSGYGYFRSWAMVNEGFTPEYISTTWPDIVEHAGGVAPCIEQLARKSGWKALKEENRTGVVQTMEKEARDGVYHGTLMDEVGPPWQAVQAVSPPPRNPVLIEGILRRGHIALLSGKAKSAKSWAGIGLAVAVALGDSWLGFQCARGKVLYIDPELDPKSLDNRFAAVCAARGVSPEEVQTRVFRWCLRGALTTNGNPPDISDLSAEVEAIGESFDLIIVDSVSCFVRGDENSSVDVRRLFSFVLSMSKAAKSAVLMIHHQGKGAKGDVDSIERSRGSSVWGDAPDAPLSLTEIFPPSGKPEDYLQEGQRAFVLEDSGLREFAGIQPVHLIFSYPVHVVDAEGVTADWKPKSGQQAGGRKTGEVNRAKSEDRANKCLLALAAEFIHTGAGADGLSAKEAAEVCSAALGEIVKPATLKGYVEESSAFDVWQKSAQRWSVVPSRPPEAGPHLAG